jgi:hypothetical protein
MKIFSKMILLFTLVIIVFTGCKRDGNVFSEYDYIDPNSGYLKINYNLALFKDPLAQIKINGVRVSGNTLRTRYPFPGGGFNTLGGSTGDYLPVKAGANEISVSIPKNGTNVDSIPLYKTTMNIETGKRYSLHLTDTANVKAITVEEDYSAPTIGSARYRFINLTPDLPMADLWVGDVKVVSNLPYLAISEPFELPATQTSISTAWYLRVAGTVPATVAASVVATYTSSSTFLANRVYTIFSCGYRTYPITGTPLDTRRPFIAFYYVR